MDAEYQVRVYERSGLEGVERPERGFKVRASNPDKAATEARARLPGLLGLSHGPNRVIVAHVSAEPGKGAPAPLVARVVQPRPMKAPRRSR